MKQRLMASLLALGMASASAVAVADVQEQNRVVEVKQGMAFGLSAVAGGILGGPVGFITGALAGAYVGDKIGDAEDVERMSNLLVNAEGRIDKLEQQLDASEDRAVAVEKFALDILDTQVLFSSGSDVLTESGLARVEALARVLIAYPQMQVRLDGFADPRGTDEYNNVLSHYRAKAVEEALIHAGVDGDNIELFSHGADRSQAAKGDLKAYAAERRVQIKVSHPRREGWACGDC